MAKKMIYKLQFGINNDVIVLNTYVITVEK